MAFFQRRLLVRALGSRSRSQIQSNGHPSAIFTRGMRQVVMSAAALEVAAERRRRKRKLRLEPPFGALQRNRDARRPPPGVKDNFPEPITVLIGERLSLHNRIQARCRADKLDEAIQGVRHAMFSNCRPTVFTCNSLLGHLQRAGRHSDVISMFKFITQAGVIPNIVTYNILILTHCEILDMDAAFEVFKKISASEYVKPSHVTFNHLMSAQFKLKNYDGVTELFREMLEKCYGADPPTYAATIEGFVNGGAIDHATELYQEMKQRGSLFSEPVFCNLIRGYFAAGRFSEAMEVFEFVPEKVERTVLSYNSVLLGMCTTGRVKEAEDFLAEMQSRDVGPNADSYAILMGGLIGLGKLDEAVTISRAYRSSSEDLGHGAVVYNVLLAEFFKAGRVLECEEIVTEMAEKRCKPSEVSYSLFIDGFFKVCRVEECLRSFRRLLDAGFSPDLDIYNKFFAYLCEVGKLDEVRELFEGMVNGGLVPDVTMYDLLIGGFEKEGRAAEVRRVFQDVLEKGVAGEELVARIGGQSQVLNGGKQEIERKHLDVTAEETKSEVAAAI